MRLFLNILVDFSQSTEWILIKKIRLAGMDPKGKSGSVEFEFTFFVIYAGSGLINEGLLGLDL